MQVRSLYVLLDQLLVSHLVNSLCLRNYMCPINFRYNLSAANKAYKDVIIEELIKIKTITYLQRLCLARCHGVKI